MTNHVQLPVYRPRAAMEQEILQLRKQLHRANVGLNAAVLEREDWRARAKKAEDELAKYQLKEAS